MGWEINIYLKFWKRNEQGKRVILNSHQIWTSCKDYTISWSKQNQNTLVNTWEWREKRDEQLTRRNQIEKMWRRGPKFGLKAKTKSWIFSLQNKASLSSSHSRMMYMNLGSKEVVFIDNITHGIIIKVVLEPMVLIKVVFFNNYSPWFYYINQGSIDKSIIIKIVRYFQN